VQPAARHGGYAGVQDDKPLIGRYLFTTAVSATTPNGFRVTRHRRMTGVIFPAGWARTAAPRTATAGATSLW